MKSSLRNVSAILGFAALVVGCNGGSTVEPYPSNWSIAGDWEITAGALTFETEYREGSRDPMVATPDLNIIDFGTDAQTFVHSSGADFFTSGADTFVVDPATGVVEMSKTQISDVAGTDCDAEVTTHLRWEFDRTGAVATGQEVTEIRFETTGAPNACRVFLSTMSDEYRMSGMFPNAFAPLHIFTYLGALDPSLLPLISVMRVTAPQTLVNTSASEAAPGATVSASSAPMSLERLQSQMASGLEQVLRARAEGRLPR